MNLTKLTRHTFHFAHSYVSHMFDDGILRTTLPNGIHIASQIRYPGVKSRFSIAVDVGSNADPFGMDGAAHYLEHTLLPSSVQKHLMRYHQATASTSNGITLISGTLPQKKQELPGFFGLLHDILTLPPEPEIAEKEKNRIRNEKNAADDYIYTRMDRFKMVNHTLDAREKVVLGTHESVGRITLTDLTEFKKRNYVGPNIYMGFTGPHAHGFHDLCAAHFSNIPKGPSQSSHELMFKGGEIRQQDPHLKQLYVRVAFPIPHSENVRQESLSGIVAEYLSHKLSDALQWDMGLLYKIVAIHFTTKGRDHDEISIMADIDPADADKLLPAIAKTLVDAIENLDVFDLKDRIAIQNIGFSIIPERSAENLAMWPMTSGIRTHFQERQAIFSIKPKEIQQFMRKYILAGEEPMLVAHGNDKKLHSLAEFRDMMHVEPAIPRPNPRNESFLSRFMQLSRT